MRIYAHLVANRLTLIEKLMGEVVVKRTHLDLFGERGSCDSSPEPQSVFKMRDKEKKKSIDVRLSYAHNPNKRKVESAIK